MDSYQKEISMIKKVLKENPKGMTVTDIARKIKINRNSVAKYLDIMRISGLVEMITFGPAKVYFPSRRVPVMQMLNYTSDYVTVYDSKMRVTMINNSFVNFLKINKQNIIGQQITDTILNFFDDYKSDLIIGLKQAIDGERFKEEIDVQKKNNIYFFRVNILPTTFEDGKNGGTMIIKNITNKKIAENVLKESEQNLKNILKKINEK